MADFDVKNQLDKIEETVMSGLKEFQRCTVKRIDALFQAEKTRVLVSDEVGLGKTLIARGVIAKFAKMRKKQQDDLVKVVYVCSNSAIADQNLKKLLISKYIKQEQTGYSRLSMQHLNIFNQEHSDELKKRYIQLIPLTPDTSFRMTLGAGTYSERALMFAVMRRLPQFLGYGDGLEMMMRYGASRGWDSWAKRFYEEEVVKCDKISNGAYLEHMLKALSAELSKPSEDGKTYFENLKEMCIAFESGTFERRDYLTLISKLRFVFAKISLDKLDPDLVIMDEFQRFRDLITSANEADSESASEMGMLAKKFFNSDRVRMLLLSATPYKMYSTLDEIDESEEDEHFTEFFSVMKFLNVTDEAQAEFKTVWSDYSVHLKELSYGDAVFLEAKNAAEDAMYKRICRTERISEEKSADIIDDSDVRVPLTVSERDIKSYLQLKELLDSMGEVCGVPVDYVKSAPYLMSFMKDYQLKKNIERYFKNNPQEIKKIDKDTFWLSRKNIDAYSKIDWGNARLDRLAQHVFKDSAENLLWVPPSRPYYELKGAFENSENFSKTLVFSSWEMVPRMIATLLSYEAERRTIGALTKSDDEKEAKYFHAKGKRYPSGRLVFSEKKGTLSGMNLFCLLYPSQFLTGCYDPIEYMNKGATLEEIEKDVSRKIAEKLEKFGNDLSREEDKSWYYMAPLLLDRQGYVSTWLGGGMELLYSMDETEEGEEGKTVKNFILHLEKLKELYGATRGGRICNLGRRPDDLLEVLTNMALASPAVVVNRTYRRYCNSAAGFSCFYPTQIAKVFLNKMNTPEATATVEMTCDPKSEDAHWQNLLTYCKQGNVQAVFDEYAHLISNGIDGTENAVDQMHEEMLGSMRLKTTVYNVDTFNSFKARVNNAKEPKTNLRSHFAVAFTKGEGKESDTDRKKKVRNAFNSPFRPFVLASTSIGQEGLDFHNYCRRIVHWNLPSNPIDLEQREGRINRFEAHVIRRNLSMRYGNITFKSNVWKEMVQYAAENEAGGQGSQLIPYWGLTPREDMVKIERIVPMYPYSRDVSTYKRLINILSLYRLTLGQARQEELLEYLFKNADESDIKEMKRIFINLSPYYKKQKSEP